MEDKEIFICACHNFEHLLIFCKDEDFVYCYSNLVHYNGFWKRLWYGIKYAFGYKSRYGAFDEFLFKPEDLQQLKTFLNESNNSR
jgi:hypothetical protein